MYEILIISNSNTCKMTVKCIFLGLLTTVMLTFCAHTSTVQLSDAININPFTDPPTKRIKETSQTQIVFSINRLVHGIEQ